jgi:hypothetical protein
MALTEFLTLSKHLLSLSAEFEYINICFGECLYETLVPREELLVSLKPRNIVAYSFKHSDQAFKILEMCSS